MRKLAIALAFLPLFAQARTEQIVTQFGVYYVNVPDASTVSSGTGYQQTLISTTAPSPVRSSTVITSSGTYQVIPNHSTGGVMAVIQTSKGHK